MEALENIANLLYEKGEPCNIGCAAKDVEAIKEQLLIEHPTKPIRIVRNWCLWSLDVTEKDLEGLVLLGLKPVMIYSTDTIWDRYAPYMQGTSVRSTLAIKFTESYLFETKNTVYVLVEQGSRKRVDPMLAISVHF